MSNSYIFFEDILKDIESTNKFDTDFLRYKEIKIYIYFFNYKILIHFNYNL